MTNEIIKDLSLLGMIIGYGISILSALSLTVGYGAYSYMERTVIEMRGGKLAVFGWRYLILGIIAHIVWSHVR